MSVQSHSLTLISVADHLSTAFPLSLHQSVVDHTEILLQPSSWLTLLSLPWTLAGFLWNSLVKANREASWPHIKKILHSDQIGFILEMQHGLTYYELINVIHQINNLKDTNHMIFSLDTHKAFDKNVIPRHDKNHGCKRYPQHKVYSLAYINLNRD